MWKKDVGVYQILNILDLNPQEKKLEQLKDRAQGSVKRLTSFSAGDATVTIT